MFKNKIAAAKNLQVLLIEQESETGGHILSVNNFNNKINGQSQNEWKNKILDELQNSKNIKIVTSTSLFAYMHYNYLLGIQDIDPNKGKRRDNSIRQVLWKIRAKKVILATGSIERPLNFNNNDRPGIMLAGSVSKYLNGYGIELGKKIF